MNYIRVETMNTHTEESLGGYICAAHTILSLKLGVPPTASDEELARIINESDDPEVTTEKKTTEAKIANLRHHAKI